jgi:uncharacterized protein YbjT (DUF2867 family)
VKYLARKNATVRAAVRDQTKAAQQLGPGIELCEFDFANQATFGRALTGVGAVFLLPPLGPDQTVIVNRFVDAAKQAGVSHIVKLSAIGSDRDPPFTVGSWHAASDRHIRNSSISFTLLRPNSFMQNFINYFPPRNGAIYLPWGNGRASFVDTRDIAEVAAQALTDENHANQIYTLTGPASLGISDVARALLEATGHQIKYVDVPESAARDGMLQAGLPQWQVDALMELHAINKQSEWNAVTRDVEKVTGRSPTDFAAFARDHAQKFV